MDTMHTGNLVKIAALMAAMTALFLFVGDMLGGNSGIVIALVIAGVMNFGSYWFSDKIALAMNGAKEVSATEAPELHRMVEQVVQLARIPMPRVYIIDTPSP